MQVQPPPHVQMDWNATPVWPSEASGNNPIKLPRQTKVQQVPLRSIALLGPSDRLQRGSCGSLYLHCKNVCEQWWPRPCGISAHCMTHQMRRTMPGRHASGPLQLLPKAECFVLHPLISAPLRPCSCPASCFVQIIANHKLC